MILDSGQGSGGENEADSGNSSLEDDNSDVQMKQLTVICDQTCKEIFLMICSAKDGKRSALIFS